MFPVIMFLCEHMYYEDVIFVVSAIHACLQPQLAK